MAVKLWPRRNVDYLTHNWREEDIWSSLRCIVSLRSEVVRGAQLENVLWRTWMKVRNNLKTVSPETLNWFVVALVFILH